MNQCKNALAGDMYLKECPQLKSERIELQMAHSIRQRLEAIITEAFGLLCDGDESGATTLLSNTIEQTTAHSAIMEGKK